MKFFRLFLTGLMATVLLPELSAGGQSAELDSQEIAFFEVKIRPLLVQHCYECHAEKKQQGRLRLDSRGGWQTGGATGPAIVAGQPDASLLIKAVRYADPALEMPPSGKLTEAEIALLTDWVARGAPDPRDTAVAVASAVDFVAAGKHWAYQPVKDPLPPDVRDPAWPYGDIDRFLLARLEELDLSPAPDADRYTWLRRATLDVTGLAPTPDEIAAFIGDDSPAAESRVVDRLLASPAYGERWARHWLDLVGYADQIGTANDVFAEFAWRYRDYVIASFNADRPFDEFIRQQIAGDLLTSADPAERAAQLTATGFLLLGNLDIVESDKAKLRVDITDQQIEKTGKTFLAQTVHCARCHDHKFDPIRLTDYYGLAGIFGSTESVYETGQGVWSAPVFTELPETPAQQAEREQRTKADTEKLAALKAQREMLAHRREETAAKLKNVPAGADPAARAALEKEQADLDGQIRQLEQQQQHFEFFAIKPPRVHAVHDKAQPADARITIRGDAHVLGDVVPRGFVAIATAGTAAAIPSHQSGRLQLADWLTNGQNPLTARVLVNRIWQKLFGAGLVRSVDYFGLRGETPSHPELLDHLASRFVRDRWSQKRLLRKLLLSRTYRMSSAGQVRGEQIDPDNRLLWRMSRRRLDAESLRDSLLAVSGDLLPIAGGPALPLEYLENVGNLSPSSVNPASFALKTFRPDQSYIRTLYLPVVRSKPQAGPADVLNFFDFMQPAQLAGQRSETAVPTQSLFLLNSPLWKEQSNKLAARLTADASQNDEQRLALLWLLVLNRPITPDETAEATEFLRAAPAATPDPPAAQQNPWHRLCHALLISNEFLFRL